MGNRGVPMMCGEVTKTLLRVDRYADAQVLIARARAGWYAARSIGDGTSICERSIYEVKRTLRQMGFKAYSLEHKHVCEATGCNSVTQNLFCRYCAGKRAN